MIEKQLPSPGGTSRVKQIPSKLSNKLPLRCFDCPSAKQGCEVKAFIPLRPSWCDQCPLEKHCRYENGSVLAR